MQKDIVSSKRILTVSGESLSSEAKRVKYQDTQATSLQDPSLLGIIEKFREVSVKEIQRLKQGGSASHTAAVDVILRKLRSQQNVEQQEEDGNEAIISQFLPGEIELVMELASISNRENATRILVLREEIYKLRKRGFKTPSIVQILIRRLMDQIENIDEDCRTEERNLVLPAANSLVKPNSKLDSHVIATTSSSKATTKDFSSLPLFDAKRQKNEGGSQLEDKGGFLSPQTSTTARAAAAATTTTTTTTTTIPSDLEGGYLRLDAESMEKMKRLKEMRKTRLQWQQRSQASISTQFSNSTKRGDHPYYNSEKHRLTKKPRGENVHNSTTASSLSSPFNISSMSSSTSSSPRHSLKNFGDA